MINYNLTLNPIINNIINNQQMVIVINYNLTWVRELQQTRVNFLTISVSWNNKRHNLECLASDF